jgi:hypothetical protein
MRNQLLVQAAKRTPGLKKIPVMKLLAAAEVAVLVREHFARLDANERRRLLHLLRLGRGRPSHLSAEDREELAVLVAKMQPRLLMGQAVEKLSPVPVPARLLYGRRGPRPA